MFMHWYKGKVSDIKHGYYKVKIHLGHHNTNSLLMVGGWGGGRVTDNAAFILSTLIIIMFFLQCTFVYFDIDQESLNIK